MECQGAKRNPGPQPALPAASFGRSVGREMSHCRKKNYSSAGTPDGWIPQGMFGTGRSLIQKPPSFRLLKLRVLRFGLLQDGDVGVGVFPVVQELLVRRESADASGVGVGTL